MRQCDAHGNTNLRRGTKRFSGVAIGAVKVPEFARPVFKRTCREHPVLVPDRLPYLGRQAWQRDWRGIPIALRLRCPFRAKRLMAFTDCSTSLRNAYSRFFRCGNLAFTELCEQGYCEGRVGHYPHVRVQQALIIHRPARQLQIAKADINPAASLRHKARHGSRGTYQFCRWLLPVASIQAQHQIGIAKYALVHAHVEWMATRKIETAIDVVDRSTDGFGKCNQVVETISVATNVLGENHRALRLEQHVRDLVERRRIWRQRRRHRHGAGWR